MSQSVKYFRPLQVFTIFISILVLCLSFCVRAEASGGEINDSTSADATHSYFFYTDEDGCNVYNELYKAFNSWSLTKYVKLAVPITFELGVAAWYGPMNPGESFAGRMLFILSLYNVFSLSSFAAEYMDMSLEPQTPDRSVAEHTIHSLTRRTPTLLAVNVGNELLFPTTYYQNGVQMSQSDRYAAASKSIAITNPIGNAIKADHSAYMQNNFGISKQTSDALASGITASYYLGTVVAGAKLGLLRAGYLGTLNLPDASLIPGLTKMALMAKENMANALMVSAAYKTEEMIRGFCLATFDTLFETVHYTEAEKAHFCLGASSAVTSVSAAMAVYKGLDTGFGATFIQNLAEAGGLVLNFFVMDAARQLSDQKFISDVAGMAAGSGVFATAMALHKNVQALGGGNIAGFAQGAGIALVIEGWDVVISHSYPLAMLALGDFITGKKGGLTAQYCAKGIKGD